MQLNTELVNTVFRGDLRLGLWEPLVTTCSLTDPNVILFSLIALRDTLCNIKYIYIYADSVTLISQLPALELMSKQSLSNTWKASLLSRRQSALAHRSTKQSCSTWADCFKLTELAHSYTYKRATGETLHRTLATAGQRGRETGSVVTRPQLRAQCRMTLCTHPGKIYGKCITSTDFVITDKFYKSLKPL